MITFAGQGILLDIEGTTASLHFVREVLFPYARKHLAVSLRNLWNDQVMVGIREGLAKLKGFDSFEAWTGGKGMPPEDRLKRMRIALNQLMDEDAKVAPLKEIQGLIWREGYADGALRSHIYPEVPRVFKEWKQRGKDVRIYSSGSVEAQKIYFQHVDNGTTDGTDLTGYLNGYYDTTTGPKKEAASYTVIAGKYGLPPGQILFLSDMVAELDAARTAGLATGLVCRDEAAPAEATDHPRLSSFDDVRLA